LIPARTPARYEESMLGFMNRFMAQINPDKALGNVLCLIEFMQEPETQYAITLISRILLIDYVAFTGSFVRRPKNTECSIMQ
jgi:hypothetical protein